MNRKSRKIIAILLAILTIGLIPVAGGCNKTEPFFPEVIRLDPLAPTMISANQLYMEYIKDDVAAAAKYEGKELWITEIFVDSYSESESGDYLIIRGYQLEGGAHRTPTSDIFNRSIIMLELQTSDTIDLTDVAMGYIVEIYGECQGILEGFAEEIDYNGLFLPIAIEIKINKIVDITKKGAMPTGEAAPW